MIQYISYKTEVTVNWQEPDYSVLEGDVLRLCASVLQTTEREFAVDIVAPLSDGMCNHV